MSELGDRPGLYSSRPAVLVDSQENEELSTGLMNVVVEETAAGLYRCELTLGNWGTKDGNVGFMYSDRQLLDFGKSLEIKAGAGQAEGIIFKGRITGLEGRYPQGSAPEILVLAEDRLQDLRMNRRTRTFEDVSDADVMRQVAAEHSLTAQVDVDGAGTHKVVAQVNQSDLAFLRDRARAVDAEVWVEGDTLHVQARSRRRTGEVSLTYGQTLREFSVLADLTGQRTSVTVSGWDVSAKEGIAAKADAAAIQGELGGQSGGSELLQQALGERKEQIAHRVPLTSDQARSAAEAAYRAAARRFVTGTGLAEGDPRIKVGAYVKLEGLGDMFNGSYYVYEVRHRYDLASGYVTQFRVERPGIG